MYFNNYLSTIDNKELVSTIQETSSFFIKKINEGFNLDKQLNGLLLGKVQSGKTAQSIGIISAMADRGYKIFILLTTDNVDLHRQTYLRVKSSLLDFNVFNEKEDELIQKEGLLRPIIIVLKKNSRVLLRWKNYFLNTEICRGLPLVIFDDEADAASLNTMVNKRLVSTINKRLSEIKKTAANTTYIQVTATPQAAILQSQISGWKPDFIYYFKPGLNYLGGNFFYPRIKSFTTVFTNNFELDDIKNEGDVVCPLGLRRSLLSFLINCAHRKLNGIYNCNFMIHPSIKISVHNQFVDVVQNHLTLLQRSSDEKAFVETLKEEWNNLQQTKPDLEIFDDILEAVIGILDNTEISVIPLNSRSYVCRDSTDPDALDLSKGFNIVIGGNTLGRGITFPNLQTVYYCRTAKTPQADTYWQHSRIFGYDREKEMIRIFIPQQLYSLFADLNVSNEILIKQVLDNINNIELIYPKRILPTRKNVVDQQYLNLVQGGVNMFASTPLPVNVRTIDMLINAYSTEVFIDCDTSIIIELLKLVKSETLDDFDTEKFISCVNGLKKRKPNIKSKLIVRKDRDIAKNTGTLLSPNDRALGERFDNEIVLTMYKITGTKEKGWDDKPRWVPNIKFPKNFFFYNMK